MALSQELQSHLLEGVTTLCRAWDLTRRDGEVMGFTDHDLDLVLDGLTYRADTGMTAKVLSQTTGLSVDNTEAVGALSDVAVTEEDILAGRYDGAQVRAWLVNWAAPEQRVLQFQGSIGEVTRTGGAFQAELRGLAEALNQAQGKIYQKPCSAILGGTGCKFDLDTPGYTVELTVEQVEDARVFQFSEIAGFDARWFENGLLQVLDGEAAGLTGLVKNDRENSDGRMVELWHSLRAAITVGDRIKLVAGCDKQAETCKVKFDNFLNFQGFPHIPGEDWLVSYPVRGNRNNGGSLSG